MSKIWRENRIERYNGLSPSGSAFALSQWLKGVPLERYNATQHSLLVKGGYHQSESPNRSVLVVCPDSRTADELTLDLKFFSSIPVYRFTSWEILPYEQLSPLTEVVANRISILDRLWQRLPTIVVTSPDALLQKSIRPDLLSACIKTLAVGGHYIREDLVNYLDLVGYRQVTLTEELGQYSLRGSVVDLFPIDSVHPVRLEFFGDSLESIRIFSSESQRSIQSIQQIRILPAKEHIQASRLSSFLVGQGQVFELSRDEELDNVVTRMRHSAEDTDISTRLLDTFEDVLRTGGDMPALEQLLPFIQFPLKSIFDFLPPATNIVYVDEQGFKMALESAESIIKERAERAKELGVIVSSDNPSFLSADYVMERLSVLDGIAFNLVSIVSFDEPSEVFGVDSQKLEIVPNSDLLIALQRNRHTELPFKPLADEIILRRSQGYEVLIAVSHTAKVKRIIELLDSYQIPAVSDNVGFSTWQSESSHRATEHKNKTTSPVILIQGYLSAGIRVQREALLVISDHEIFPDISLRRPTKSAQQAKRLLGSTSQIKDDDYVVHIDHGIALYRGLKSITVEGRTGDFLQLEYLEGAKLFVPVENIGRIQKYVGADGIKPQLSRLGGKAWSATKEKVRKNVQELAGQLLNLYAERELTPGFSYREPNEDDQLFADTFPYEETKDQEKAISDVLLDMSRSKPMDRLVCGDVGYGKTEVALRATFKAVNEGKQVAILVPTTILADQHLKTFNGRLSEFGFNVRAVSRFIPASKNKETLQDLANGTVDVIIGTHRLLQNDVYFRELGLLIIDEEHRFGVQDKERLKKLKKQLDVLTLTATPIPRTLQMSMLDIRDLSVIESPPTDRQVIQTFLASYQDATVREAILRELKRSGQIFYIHNRVQNIELITNELRTIVPEARIEFAHGQMKDSELENVMHRFIQHEFDVLVSTTIVESGLDIPNANTIIIRNADRFGLAELYQLRGRVGRSSRRAYSYFLVSNAQMLTGDAKKRLKVLQSLDDLGMGFRLALQDMEIRGAGNLLGKDQSGKVELVGFELYTKILREAVRELRRRKKRDSSLQGGELPLEILIDPEVSIGFPAHIPNFYIPDVEERLLLYQRLVEIRDEDEARDIEEEIRDRFGNPPVEVDLLLDVMRFRSTLRRAGIVSATRRGLSLSLAFHKDANIDLEKLMALVNRSSGKMRMTQVNSLVLTLESEPESPSILTKKVSALIELVTHKATSV